MNKVLSERKKKKHLQNKKIPKTAPIERKIFTNKRD